MSVDCPEGGTDTPADFSKKKVGRWLRRILACSLAGLTVAAAVTVGVLRAGEIEQNESEPPPRSREFLWGEVVDTSKATYSYEEMTEDLFLLRETYPDLLRVASAGTSLDGREIYYADLGAENAERQIFISAGIHGREYMTPLLTMKLIEYYLLNYDTETEDGTAFADGMENCAFRIVPMANPDGVTISQKGIEGLRSETLRQTVRDVYASDCAMYASYRENYASLEEYLVDWKANAAGVDLNRNFGIAYWSEMKTGIGQPSAQKYKGESAESEPETKILKGLLEELTNPVCVVSFHSQGELLYWDCGQSGEVRVKNEALVGLVAEVTGYRLQESFTVPDATFDDWCALEKGIPSVNIETGTDRCPLPIEQFPIIWEQIKGLFPRLTAFGEETGRVPT